MTIDDQVRDKKLQYDINKEAAKISDEITKLNEKVNLDNLIYRYKGETPDENFDRYDNALNIIDKIKNGNIKLADVKRYQIKFKSNLGKIKKGSNKKDQRSKKTNYTILTCFTKQETRLLNFMMIIL